MGLEILDLKPYGAIYENGRAALAVIMALHNQGGTPAPVSPASSQHWLLDAAGRLLEELNPPEEDPGHVADLTLVPVGVPFDIDRKFRSPKTSMEAKRDYQIRSLLVLPDGTTVTLTKTFRLDRVALGS
jgi:hypothetical protein